MRRPPRAIPIVSSRCPPAIAHYGHILVASPSAPRLVSKPSMIRLDESTLPAIPAPEVAWGAAGMCDPNALPMREGLVMEMKLLVGIARTGPKSSMVSLIQAAMMVEPLPTAHGTLPKTTSLCQVLCGWLCP